MRPSPQNDARIVVNFTYFFAESASTRLVELIELDATYIPPRTVAALCFSAVRIALYGALECVFLSLIGIKTRLDRFVIYLPRRVSALECEPLPVCMRLASQKRLENP